MSRILIVRAKFQSIATCETQNTIHVIFWPLISKYWRNQGEHDLTYFFSAIKIQSGDIPENTISYDFSAIDFRSRKPPDSLFLWCFPLRALLEQIFAILKFIHIISWKCAILFWSENDARAIPGQLCELSLNRGQKIVKKSYGLAWPFIQTIWNQFLSKKSFIWG